MRIDGYEIEVTDLLQRWGMGDYQIVGDELNVRCPWKKHRTGGRKFYINSRTGLWNCQACTEDSGHKSGNIKKLISLFEDIEWWDLSDWLRRHGRETNLDDFDEHIIEILYGENTPIRRTSIKKLRRETGRVLKRSSMPLHGDSYWRRSRGFTETTIKFWNLRENWDFTRPYIIPITVDGLNYFHVKRSADDKYVMRPKYLFQKGFPRREILFGLDRGDAETLVICEGMVDCMMIWQALQRNSLLDKYAPVAVLGTSISEEQMEQIRDNSDDVILFFDNDEPGRSAAEKFLKENRRVGISFVDYGKIKEGDPGDLTEKQIIRMIRHPIDALEYRIFKELRGG